MGYWKNFAYFCHIEGLDPDKPFSHRAYELDREGRPWARAEVPEIDDDAPLTWEQIDQQIGGASGTINLPCPYCGSDKPYSTRMRITRTILSASWRCYYCGANGKVENPDPVPDELIEEDAKFVREQEESKRRENFETAMGIWQSAAAVSPDTHGNEYLKARGLILPPDAHEVLRWHPYCPWKRRDRFEPCIVALFRDAITDQPTGIHRIRPYSLIATEKMSLGSWPKGNAGVVKLWPLGNSETLAVGEGLENTLSAVQLGVASPPAWATTVALKLARLPVIAGVKRLIILADNDASGTGERVARQLRRTWQARGREVIARMPRTVGSDFNEILRNDSCESKS